MKFGSQSMVAPLRRVAVKRPEQAFRRIDQEWQELNYTRPPNLSRAEEHHREFVALMQRSGAEILSLPEDGRTGLDSLYAHDPVLVTDRGALIFQTGKIARRGEGPAFADAFTRWGVPILGVIDGRATAEAGDMVWLDHDTLLVGRGFRTNAEGVERLAEMLKPGGTTVIPFELPYWNGPHDVLHLMSFISLLDNDLAVVYRRLLPVPLFELLRTGGCSSWMSPTRSTKRSAVMCWQSPGVTSSWWQAIPSQGVVWRLPAAPCPRLTAVKSVCLAPAVRLV